MLDRSTLDACATCLARAAQQDPIVEIDRRDFIVRGAILAAAAALTACGADSNATAPTIAAGSTIQVNDYPSLANVGGVALVSVSGAPLAVVRTSASSFLALSRVCPHQGSIVNPNGTSGFLCPNHGAQFDINGKWIGGQRTTNMRSYASTYDPATGVLTLS